MTDDKVVNYVKEVYAPFTDEEISDKIRDLLLPKDFASEVVVISKPLRIFIRPALKTLATGISLATILPMEAIEW